MRIIQRLLAFCAMLATVAVVAGAFGLHLLAQGQSPALLRAVLRHVAAAVEGQLTDQLTLEARLRPGDRLIEATAHLHVRADGAVRNRLFFFLNSGLQVDGVWEETAADARAPLPYLRLGPLMGIELARPLSAGESSRIAVAYRGDPLMGGADVGRSAWSAERVVLRPADLWYPDDFQSFFTVHAAVTFPASLALAHNGREVERVSLGDSTRVRWTSERPVSGLALVAGRYREASRAEGDSVHRAFVDASLQADPERVLSSAAAAETILAERYGPSGFSRHTVCVMPGLTQSFHDGSGLIVLAAADLREGDYGFARIARAVAHDWWGATVAERRLRPETGGRWIVDGFAAFSGLVAVREHLGVEALVRGLEREAFDPRHVAPLATAGALDEWLAPSVRPANDGKGAYVTLMLQHTLGADAFYAAARRFLEEFRYRLVTDGDIERQFGRFTGRDLSGFFTAWVRSDAFLDLSLDPRDGGSVVRRHGTAAAPKSLDLWRIPSEGDPERQTTTEEAANALGDATRVVLDPELLVADMFRYNNVLPRRPRNPRVVARSVRGDVMVTFGETAPWEPATVEYLDRSGRTLHTWTFDDGLQADPVWSADGTRVLVVEADQAGRRNLLALNVLDGSWPTIAHDEAATATAEHTIVARGDRLLRLERGREVSLVRHGQARIERPLAAPDGRRVAYVARRGGQMDLRVVATDGTDDRLILTREASAVRWQWAPDSSRLFAVLPGDLDWQVWELPADGTGPRALVREAAAIGGIAASPNGERLAVLAVPVPDYGHEQWEVAVLELPGGSVRRWPLVGQRGYGLTWLDDATVLVIVADTRDPARPAPREIRRLAIADGSLTPFP